MEQQTKELRILRVVLSKLKMQNLPTGDCSDQLVVNSNDFEKFIAKITPKKDADGGYHRVKTELIEEEKEIKEGNYDDSDSNRSADSKVSFSIVVFKIFLQAVQVSRYWTNISRANRRRAREPV